MTPTAPDIRIAYLDAARAAVRLLASPRLRDGWTAESVLTGWSNGLLAGHLARSLLQVEWFLDGVEPDEARVDAVDYYAALRGVRDPDSALNVGVMARSQETTDLGWAALVEAVQACAVVLERRVPDEPEDRRVDSFGRPMLLDQYLRTRLVELCVHGDDLALSLGVATTAPPGSVAQAAVLLVEVAMRKNEPLGVLRALTRRERDEVDALRVL